MRRRLYFNHLILIMFCTYPITSTALSASPIIQEKPLYLSIVATEENNLEFLAKQAELSKHFKNLKIINSNDCSNLKPGLVLLASDISFNKNKIMQALTAAKKHVTDSYLRECKVNKNSLIYYKQEFIDSSILSLPSNTISWTFDDVHSEFKSLSNSYALVIKRTYSGNPHDEVEGRQAAVFLFDKTSGNNKKLLKQCWNLEYVALSNNTLTFQCMTAIAGNTPIHSVYVFNSKNKNLLFTKQYCQKPVSINNHILQCDEESVNELGELNLKRAEFAY